MKTLSAAFYVAMTPRQFIKAFVREQQERGCSVREGKQEDEVDRSAGWAVSSLTGCSPTAPQLDEPSRAGDRNMFINSPSIRDKQSSSQSQCRKPR